MFFDLFWSISSGLSSFSLTNPHLWHTPHGNQGKWTPYPSKVGTVAPKRPFLVDFLAFFTSFGAFRVDFRHFLLQTPIYDTPHGNKGKWTTFLPKVGTVAPKRPFLVDFLAFFTSFGAFRVDLRHFL